MAKKAKRQQLIAAVEVAGPSGAGKTLGALLMAYGMMKEKYPELTDEQAWDKIGLVDTEHERSLVYEGMTHQGVKIGEFWFEALEAPYSVSRYDNAVKSLLKEGVEVVIIDSISHAWDSDGGLLDLQQAKGGNFQAWRDVNPVYNDFIGLVTGEKYHVHTIATVRLKQEYQVSQTETGKLQVQKLGLKQVQRDSLEYEFQIVFNVNMDHVATTSKDNSGIFEASPGKLSPEYGRKLIQWLDKGIDVKGEEEKERQDFISLVRQAEAEFNGPIAAKIKEIEDNMTKRTGKPVKLENFPLNLAQLAWQRVNEVINQMEIAAAAEEKQA